MFDGVGKEEISLTQVYLCDSQVMSGRCTFVFDPGVLNTTEHPTSLVSLHIMPTGYRFVRYN
jgi:hypothetical protein